MYTAMYLDALKGLEVLVGLGVELGELLGQVRAHVRVHLLHSLSYLQRVLHCCDGVGKCGVLLQWFVRYLDTK